MVGNAGLCGFWLAPLMATRVSSQMPVSEDKTLFFPVANAININSPNVCGSPPENEPVTDLRAMSKATVDGAKET